MCFGGVCSVREAIVEIEERQAEVRHGGALIDRRAKGTGTRTSEPGSWDTPLDTAEDAERGCDPYASHLWMG